MELGAFSISLAVTNLDASKTFYEALGFSSIGGEPDSGWAIMRNGQTTIGLFEGMFERNMLTFNPGWDQHGANLDKFSDIRDIQQQLRARKISLGNEVDESTSGPASILIEDPDGNPILIDQHV